jgi:hypothetical protein
VTKRVFLTLYHEGRPRPEGFVAKARSKADGGEPVTKLDLLCIALDAMGFEVSFTSRPDFDDVEYQAIDGETPREPLTWEEALTK